MYIYAHTFHLFENIFIQASVQWQPGWSHGHNCSRGGGGLLQQNTLVSRENTFMGLGRDGQRKDPNSLPVEENTSFLVLWATAAVAAMQRKPCHFCLLRKDWLATITEWHTPQETHHFPTAGLVLTDPKCTTWCRSVSQDSTLVTMFLDPTPIPAASLSWRNLMRELL